MSSREKQYLVYMHTAPNGKKYIGITCQKLSRRWHAGQGYKSNTHFYRAIKKYGWANIKHEVIADNLAKEKACELEQLYIKKLGTRDQKKGYNNTIGGECGSAGYKITEEAREKLRKANTGKHHSKKTCERLRELERERWLNAEYRENQIRKRQGKTPWNKGKTTSAEARAKQRKAKLGKYMGSEHWNSKLVINLDTGKIYGSFGEIARELNIKSASHVVAVCKGRKERAYGYHWAYAKGGIKCV